MAILDRLNNSVRKLTRTFDPGYNLIPRRAGPRLDPSPKTNGRISHDTIEAIIDPFPNHGSTKREFNPDRQLNRVGPPVKFPTSPYSNINPKTHRPYLPKPRSI